MQSGDKEALYSTTSRLPALLAHFLTSDCIGGYSHSIPSGFFTHTPDSMKAASNRNTAKPRLRILFLRTCAANRDSDSIQLRMRYAQPTLAGSGTQPRLSATLAVAQMHIPPSPSNLHNFHRFLAAQKIHSHKINPGGAGM